MYVSMSIRTAKVLGIDEYYYGSAEGIYLN